MSVGQRKSLSPYEHSDALTLSHGDSMVNNVIMMFNSILLGSAILIAYE